MTLTKTMLNESLQRIELDFEKTLPAFIENIEYTNKLSREVIKHVDFSKGKFFTLLPPAAYLENIYNFWNSIIPRYKILNDEPGNRCHGTSEAMAHILKLYMEIDHYVFVSDNAIAFRSDPGIQKRDYLFNYYNDEVYFVANQECSEENIHRILWESDLRWHMLFVIARGKYEWKKELNEEFFESVCQNVECILTTAYDAESYILWESTRRII